MAGRSDQVAILIGSDRDREKKDRSMIDRLIAIPLDQSRFSRYLFANLMHNLPLIIFDKMFKYLVFSFMNDNLF